MAVIAVGTSPVFCYKAKPIKLCIRHNKFPNSRKSYAMPHFSQQGSNLPLWVNYLDFALKIAHRGNTGSHRGKKNSKRKLQKEIENVRNIQKKRVICVLDEAHLLEKETLEEFRFLLNYRFDSASPMSLILTDRAVGSETETAELCRHPTED